MKRLKLFAFGAAVCVIAVLMVATIVEKLYGTEFVTRYFYGCGWFVVLWGSLATVSSAYLLRRKLWRRPSAFLFHAAFAVILCGAFVTRVWGEQGTLHLRTNGEAVDTFTDRDGEMRAMPFKISLDEFRIVCYPGTQAPMDYVSELTICDNGETRQFSISMNRILRFGGYRFYQSGYDADRMGSAVAVAYDPFGTGITYFGYALLLLAMLAILVDPNSGFRKLLQHPLLRGGMVAVMGSISFVAHGAESVPPTVPRNVAAEFGTIGVYYNDRICPLSTLAHDFTVKLCGRSGYRGLTSEQVLAGWLFYYDEWKHEPMIRIKSGDVRRRMNLDGRWAELADFRLLLENSDGERSDSEAEEKFRLVGMVCTGNMLRLFPYADTADGTLHWISQVDAPPCGMPYEQRLFIRRSMNYLNELVARKDWQSVSEVIGKIARYQRKVAGDNMPSELKFRAERIYGEFQRPLPIAVMLFLLGMGAFVYAVRCAMLRRHFGRRVCSILLGVLTLFAVWLTVMLALRWWIGGHVPMSNGFETMQCLAWCTLVVTMVLGRKFVLLLPFGYLVGGLAMMVSSIGASNPQITPLMPALSSPLLSVHVMLVMIAYSLFALVMCNGVAGAIVYRTDAEYSERLRVVGLAMLYPAVFALAAGIFAGAVWANISWGRYWGWDPKEVWALITMMIYAFALHGESLPSFRRPLFFHVFCIVSFVAVIFTYFGVNLLLGGLHSYAG